MKKRLNCNDSISQNSQQHELLLQLPPNIMNHEPLFWLIVNITAHRD